MILASLLSAAVWWYASHKNRLIDPNLDQHQRRREAIGPLLGAGVFLLSIGLAFINENLARLAWMLVVLTQPYYSSKLQTPSVK
jgi:hypothetical protein